VIWTARGRGEALAGAKATTGDDAYRNQEALNGKVVDWMEKVGDDLYPAF